MKDLVPLGNGNSRFLKSSISSDITFTQMVEMLRNGTFPIDFNGINPSGIAQDGTPINKSTMLTDETEEAIWGNAQDRTVDDALSAVNYQIGDTLTTARTDLGDSWLLCNGATISVNDYPKLNILPPQFSGVWDSQTAEKKVARIRYVNGYFVMFGSGSHGGIYYTQDPSLGWTKMDLNPYYAYDIAYGNGYFVIIYRASSSAIYGVYYTSSLSLSGESYTSSQRIGESISFGDGYFVTVGGSAKSFYASDPTSSSNWTQTTGISTSNDFTDIAYGNGFFVAIDDQSHVFYKSSPTGSWTQYGVNSKKFLSVKFLNGSFFICSANGTYYTQDPSSSGNWTLLSTLSPEAGQNDITFGGGYYVAIASGQNSKIGIYYSKSLTEEFVLNPSLGNSSSYNTLAFGNGIFVTGSDTTTTVYFASGSKVSLPQISLDKTYTYIKAK